MRGFLLMRWEVDFEPAGRRAKLGKVSVELADPAADRRTALEKDHVAADLGRLHGGGDAGDAAADDEDGLAPGSFGHRLPMLLLWTVRPETPYGPHPSLHTSFADPS